MEIAPGQVISHFRIVEKAGGGGTGVVYRARDLDLDRDVALKFVTGRARRDEQGERRFRREAAAVTRLDHPNIASIEEFDAHDRTPFVVIEWVEGPALDAVIAGAPLEEPKLLDLGAQISSALEYAHRQGIIHRDLKPAKIRIRPDGTVKILDFGLAKLWKKSSDTAAMITFPGVREILGTLPYIAPEVLDGSPATTSSDIYSFGAVLYEAATGKRAFPQSDFESLMAAILERPPAPPREVNGRISESLERVILKALEKKPAARYATAEEIGDDIRRVGEGLPPAPSRARRKPWRGIQIAAVVALVVAVSVPGLVSRRSARGVPTIKALASTAADEWSPQISPDGQWISYLANRDQRVALWLQRMSGGNPIRLASDDGITSAVWSPDGESIAFLTSGEDAASVRIVAAFAGRAAATSFPLPAGFRDARLIRWIGTKIYVEEPGVALHRIDALTGTLEKVMDSQGARAMDVREDEGQVVYEARRERQMTIWTSGIDGRNRMLLTKGRHNDFAPRFGGDSIVFSSNRAGQPDLWRLNENGEAEQLTFNRSAENVSDVATDGSLVAYVELREQPRSAYETRGERKSPDGRRVAFFRRVGDTFELRVRDAELSHEWVLTSALQVPRLDAFPREWNRVNFEWSADSDEVVFVERSPVGEQQIAMSDGDGSHILLVGPQHGVEYVDVAPSPGNAHLAFVAMSAGASQIHALDRKGDVVTRIFSMQHGWNESLYLRGWLSRDEVVALRTAMNDDRTERTTVVIVDLDGSAREVVTLPRAFAATARLDAKRRTLYLTGVDDSAMHNIVAVDLKTGTTTPLTTNDRRGVTFAAVTLDPAGTPLYARQEINQDVWTIEFR